MTDEIKAKLSQISAKLTSDIDSTLRYYLWPRTISIDKYYSMLRDIVSHAVAYSNDCSELLVSNVIHELEVNLNDQKEYEDHA